MTKTKQTAPAPGRPGSILAWVLLGLCALSLVAGCLAQGPAPAGDRYAAAGHAVSAGPVTGTATGALRLNQADAAAITRLPGIGEKLAQAIVDEREANGPFYYPEDLARISGIGEKKVEAIRGLIDLTEEDVP